MNPQIRALLWKEWREWRGLFLWCLVGMIGATAYAVAYEISRSSREAVASFHSLGMLYALFLPLFFAMRASLRETSDRTRSFSIGLPVALRLQSWFRLAGGAFALVLPILVGAIVLSTALGFGWIEQVAPYDKTMPHASLVSFSEVSAVLFTWTGTTAIALSASTLYLLLAMLGTRLRSEVGLGFAGAAGAIGWFFSQALVLGLKMRGFDLSASLLGIVTPAAMFVPGNHSSDADLGLTEAIGVPLFGNLVVQCLLAWNLVRLDGRLLPLALPGDGETLSGRDFVHLAWRLRTPTRSLLWLSMRQAIPAALPGLLFAATLAAFNSHHSVRGFMDGLGHGIAFSGLAWATVVGAGIFAAEIDPRIGGFWRSRPIGLHRLFVMKFLFGLAIVLLVLDGTIVAVTWSSPNWGRYKSMNWPLITIFVPLHASMFSIAVAWTCLLRRPVLGGLAAIGSFALLEAVLGWSPDIYRYAPVEMYNSMSFLDRGGSPSGYLVTLIAMAFVIVTAYLIGWRALSRQESSRAVVLRTAV